MPAAVLCEGLKKRYGPHHALSGLDLEVPQGTLFGPRKSTTLRILSGLVRANAGTASIFGVDVGNYNGENYPTLTTNKKIHDEAKQLFNTQ